VILNANGTPACSGRHVLLGIWLVDANNPNNATVNIGDVVSINCTAVSRHPSSLPMDTTATDKSASRRRHGEVRPGTRPAVSFSPDALVPLTSIAPIASALA